MRCSALHIHSQINPFEMIHMQRGGTNERGHILFYLEGLFFLLFWLSLVKRWTPPPPPLISVQEGTVNQWPRVTHSFTPPSLPAGHRYTSCLVRSVTQRERTTNETELSPTGTTRQSSGVETERGGKCEECQQFVQHRGESAWAAVRTLINSCSFQLGCVCGVVVCAQMTGVCVFV